MRAVAIIGGGFCGTVTAVNLGRLARGPLTVTIFNHRYPLARGVAYGTRRPEHLLNVPARFAAPARKPMLHLPAHWPWQTAWKTLWDNVIGYHYPTAQPRAA